MILRFLGLLHVERQTGLVTVRVVTVSIQQSAVTVLIFNVLVQVVVDKVEFGRFLANVLLVDGHADQMHLVEGSAFRAEPRVPGAILTVVEHLAVDSLVGIVTVFLLCAVKVRLLQQQLQLVGFDLFLLFQQLGLFTVLLRLGLQLWSTRFLDFVRLRTSFVISWIIRAFGRLLRLRDRWLRSSRFNINVRSAGFWDNGRTHRLRLLRLWWLLSGSLRDELLFLGRVDEPVLFLIDFGLRLGLGLGLGLRLRPDRCTRSDEFFRSLSQTGRSWGYDTLGLFQLILAGF